MRCKLTFLAILLAFVVNLNQLFAYEKPKFSTAGFYSVDGSARSVYNFNLGWRFFKGEVEGAEKPSFDDSAWEAASVPHGLEILGENASGGRNYQGVAWYRKSFTIDRAKGSERLFLYFEAVMGKSKVWVNGVEMTQHFGGYLPFAMDVTDVANYDGKQNIVAVMADNSDDQSYPMGKNQAGADLSFFGGIYRDVYLIETPSVHLTLPELSSRVAGGGVFVATTKLVGSSAELTVRAEVENKSPKTQKIIVRNILQDADYNNLKSVEKKFTLSCGKTYQTEQKIAIKDARYWSSEDPYLHYIKTEVWVNGELEDTYRTRFGIRTIEMRGAEGLFLNGKPFNNKLAGANRHQDYVYVGNALPNSGQWRDVKILREGGCNIIRAAHYPLDAAYYDACDELGMFTTSANPGWHYYNFKNPDFEKRLYEDTRNLVRKDRNRPSMIMWETALNETPTQPAHVMHNMHLAAHEEYPFNGMYTVTDIQEAQKAGMDIYYHGDDPNINSFVRECGDGNDVDNWYSHNSIVRVKTEWGEKAMLGQAVDYAETFSRVMFNPSKVKLGGALWAGFEHQRGYHPDPFWGGLANLYRLPKYSYYLYRSQYSPEYKIQNKEVGAMLYIVNELTQLSPNDVTIYSNCDEVRLSFYGEYIGTAKPSTDPIYANLPHPPFVFKDAFHVSKVKKPGVNKAFTAEMIAEGVIDGEVVVTTKKVYALRSEGIKLEVANEGIDLVADGSDFVPVHAYIIDVNGNKKVLASEYVHFVVEGEGEIIGGKDNNINPMKTQFGVASILVRATNKSGKIRVRAYSEGLKSDVIEFKSVATDMKMNFDADYMVNSVKPDMDRVVIVSQERDDTPVDVKRLQEEIKSLRSEIVGKDQEIMELRSKK